MKIKSGLDPGYNNQDVKDFLDAIVDACEMLEVLGQIQATVGGLNMEHRSGKTFNCRAALDNYLGQIEIE